MKKQLVALVAGTALTIFAAGCGGDTGNSNASNTTGPVTTNTNMPANMNGKTANANQAVVTNNNGNANTAGVKTTNTATKDKATGNANHGNSNMKH